MPPTPGLLPPTPAPQRRLRLFDATTLVVGSMIGSGVFLALPLMARKVPAPEVLIVLWILGGLFTVLGANCCAELAAMLPRAGGQYVFLREAFGDLWAFLFGWTQFLIIQTGTNAAVALAFAKYVGSVNDKCGEENVLWRLTFPAWFGVVNEAEPATWTLGVNSAQLVAALVVILLTAVNIRGLREGVWVQNSFTVLKVMAILALIVGGLTFGLQSGRVFPPADAAPIENFFATAFLAALAVALSKAMFAYDAWYGVTFVAEEVRESSSTLPKALLLGTVTVTIVYVLVNLAYLMVLPVDDIARVKEDRVAELMGARLFGRVGAWLVIAAVLISTFGCLNGLILSGARLCWAMAREGLFLRSAARLSPRSGTPATALVYQAIVTIVLVFTGSYDKLLTYTMFASIFFIGLTVAAVYRLRATRPDLPRPFRCWGYPVTPAVYLAMCLAFLVYTILGDPWASGVGGLLMLSGIPFFLFWRKRTGAMI